MTIQEAKAHGFLIDPEDEHLFETYKYSFNQTTKRFIRFKTVKGGKLFVPLYYDIIGTPPENEEVDHINRNSLDERKQNLRFATHVQNSANRVYKKGSSGYRGVTWFIRLSRWKAQITHKYKNLHLGYFDTPEQAARAYDEKARELNGEFATLNFPQHENPYQ